MRSGHAAILGVAASLALVLPGCGGDEAAAGRTTTATFDKAKIAIGSGEESRQPGGSRAQARPSAAAKRCSRTLGEFLDAMESLANSLAVGLDYERYLGAVDGVRATYAEVDADRLGLVCLGRVAGPAERSLNVYIDAANEWGACLSSAIWATEDAVWRRSGAVICGETLWGGPLARARGGLRSVN